eukprot:SAG11_NODE_4723_length_1792_cov_1.163615_2_plen_424_part_00
MIPRCFDRVRIRQVRSTIGFPIGPTAVSAGSATRLEFEAGFTAAMAAALGAGAAVSPADVAVDHITAAERRRSRRRLLSAGPAAVRRLQQAVVVRFHVEVPASVAPAAANLFATAAASSAPIVVAVAGRTIEATPSEAMTAPTVTRIPDRDCAGVWLACSFDRGDGRCARAYVVTVPPFGAGAECVFANTAREVCPADEAACVEGAAAAAEEERQRAETRARRAVDGGKEGGMDESEVGRVVVFAVLGAVFGGCLLLRLLRPKPAQPAASAVADGAVDATNKAAAMVEESAAFGVGTVVEARYRDRQWYSAVVVRPAAGGAEVRYAECGAIELVFSADIRLPATPAGWAPPVLPPVLPPIPPSVPTPMGNAPTLPPPPPPTDVAEPSFGGGAKPQTARPPPPVPARRVERRPPPPPPPPRRQP